MPGLRPDGTGVPTGLHQRGRQEEPPGLDEARIEGMPAHETRRTIALAGAPRALGESENIRNGRAFIDSLLDTKDVAQIRDLANELRFDSAYERESLAAYATAKLKAIDPEARDASLAALVLLKVILHLVPEKADELDPLMRGVRATVENKLGSAQFPALRDVAHAVKTAQIVGDLGTEADLQLERRMITSARARLHAVGTQEVIEFVGAKLNLHRQANERQAASLREQFERSLGYRTRVIGGSSVLVRGEPAPGFEGIAKRITRERGEYYYTTEAGERWRVGLTYKDGADAMLTLRRVGGSGAASIHHTKLVEMADAKQFDQYLHAISEAAAAENNPAARTRLREHDLTRNGTAFITVNPQRYDIVTAANVTHAMLLENVLMRRYGRVVEPTHIFSDNPMVEIRAAIRNTLRQSPNVRDIFLQLHEHGAPTGIGFSPQITAADLAQLSNEFPNVDLHIMTIACFGGGLRPALQREIQRDPRLAQRLHFYAHTQPEVQAVSLGADDSRHIYSAEMASTPYMLTLIKKLAEGNVKTFGEAVDEADTESQEILPINPETLINGEFFGESQRPSRDQVYA